MATQPINGSEDYVDNQDLGYSTINDHNNRNAHTGYLVIINKTETAPPGGESNGDAWIVAGSATGDWSGHDDEVALYYDGWIFRDLALGEVFTDLSLGASALGRVEIKTTTGPAYQTVFNTA